MSAAKLEMNIIAHIRTQFAGKFGVPRQAGVVEELRGLVVFTPEYRNPEALRGLEGFSYIWLIWQFSQAVRDTWSPTVRPPRLGGNTRMGVFATRSPFRPNAIGLSSVRLVDIRQEPGLGTVLEVAGADLMDGTPILDIKPYLPYTDSHPQATGGFTDLGWDKLEVQIAPQLLEKIPPRDRPGLIGVLEQDPRPSYQKKQQREYGMTFGGNNIRFVVEGSLCRVTAVEPAENSEKTS